MHFSKTYTTLFYTFLIKIEADSHVPHVLEHKIHLFRSKFCLSCLLLVVNFIMLSLFFLDCSPSLLIMFRAFSKRVESPRLKVMRVDNPAVFQ